MDEVDAGPPPGIRDASGDTGEPRAWRLTYTFDAQGVRLAAQQQVATTAPPDDGPRIPSGAAGYWVELRDGEGAPLYRQLLSDPFHPVLEAHSPEPGTSPTHVPVREPSGAFQVVVPALPEAAEVVLQGLRAPGGARQGERDDADASRRTGTHPLLTAPLAETPPFEVT